MLVSCALSVRAVRALTAVTALGLLSPSAAASEASPPGDAPTAEPPRQVHAVLPGDLLPPADGPDSVFLAGGVVLRGTLVEVVPNDHVTLRLPSGQSTVIEWSRIDRMVGGADAAPSARGESRVAPAHVRAAGAPVRLADVPGPRVFVHLEADAAVALEAASSTGGPWERICTAPCNAAVPVAHRYRIGGENVRVSKPFELAAQAGQGVTLAVKPGWSAGFTGGIVALASGGLAFVSGGLVLLLASYCAPWSWAACPDHSDLKTEGALLMGAGGVVMGVGVVLVLVNPSSTVTVKSGEGPPRAPDRAEAAWLRTPIWRDAPNRLATAPKMIGVPIFTREF